MKLCRRRTKSSIGSFETTAYHKNLLKKWKCNLFIANFYFHFTKNSFTNEFKFFLFIFVVKKTWNRRNSAIRRKPNLSNDWKKKLIEKKSRRIKKSCVKGLAKISSYNGQQIILIKMVILAFKGPYFF